MNCPKCGTQIQYGDLFCISCGTKVTPLSENANNGEASSMLSPTDSLRPNPVPPYSEPIRQNPSEYAQQPPVRQNPSGYAQQPPVRQDRSFAKFLLLSIVTLGIYGIYFEYCMIKDINIICQEDGKTTPGIVVLILLNCVTLGIYSSWWIYCFAERLDNYIARKQFSLKSDAINILLWNSFGYFLFGLGPIIAFYKLIQNMNDVSLVYNRH